MRRPRRSREELQRIRKQIEKNELLDQRRRRLYNRKYRKSFFFIAVWAGRITYFILFFVVLFLHTTPAERRAEIVIHVSVEDYDARTKMSSQKQRDVSIQTGYGNYTSTFIRNYPPAMNEGDTVLIERNLFRKPIFFTKSGWYEKYMIDSHVLPYFIVLMLTFLSFFFNDGLDRFTDKLFLFIWALDIITALCYFLY
jgi:hypothetical protein